MIMRTADEGRKHGSSHRKTAKFEGTCSSELHLICGVLPVLSIVLRLYCFHTPMHWGVA